VSSPADPYLIGRLELVRGRVAAAVASRRSGDPNPDDGFRGLYLTDDHVDALLAAGRVPAAPPPQGTAARRAALEAEADGALAPSPLRALTRAFALTAEAVEVLLVALAPDLDPGFERLYGYLHDDVTRRRASAGLALELVGAGPADAAGRALLHPGGPLVGPGLLVVEDLDRPFLTRALRVPDRVVDHVLGGQKPDPVLAALEVGVPPLAGAGSTSLARAIGAGLDLAYVVERPGASGASLAVAALAEAGRSALVLDLAWLDPADPPGPLVLAAAREARLRDAWLVAGPVDALADRGPAAVSAFADAGIALVLTGSRDWDPRWSRSIPLVLSAEVLGAGGRVSAWSAALGPLVAGCDLEAATAAHRLTPLQIGRAAGAARVLAAAQGRVPTAADVQAGARQQNAASLSRLARRIAPGAGWDDLVLGPTTVAQLRELVVRFRHRDAVLGSAAGSSRPSRGRGVTALFAGESGTGKTLAAEVVAGSLGLDVYLIDLSTVVDKYVGETEKNLERVFAEADQVNGVLLFDEADAVFGKRSEVRDAHDRYANVEIAYLLQRMERFDGLALLTTNLRSNLDDAFTRRLDAVIEFPVPDEDQRRRLWELHLARFPEPAADVDVGFLAGRLRLAGGAIANVVLGAAFLAVEEGGPISMSHLVRAAEREYRKLGHLCTPEEFGPWFALVVAT